MSSSSADQPAQNETLNDERATGVRPEDEVLVEGWEQYGRVDVVGLVDCCLFSFLLTNGSSDRPHQLNLPALPSTKTPAAVLLANRK